MARGKGLTAAQIQELVGGLAVTVEPIGRLQEYAGNAKEHTAEQVGQIKESMRQVGFCDPIGVWTNAEGKSEVVEGHGRLMAALELGLESVPVIHLDGLTDEQRRFYALVHNKLTMSTGWDFGKLDAELRELSDFDMADFGFDVDGLGFGEEDEAANADDVPEVDESEPPTAKRGQVWKLGEHRLMCGDSTSADDVAKLMGGGAADLLLTDPPYNVAYTGKTKDAMRIENDSMADAEFRAFLRDAFAAADSAMKPGASFYVFHADSEGFNFRGACRDVGWQVRECLIWVKNSMVLGRQDYQWRHEPCLYGWKSGAAHKWRSDRSQTTVMEFDRPTANKEHPTMKPVALFGYLIENSTDKGDVVLDLFGGSGTAMVAAEKLGRRSRLMELDPRYCDVVIRRWEEMTGGEAVVIE